MTRNTFVGRHAGKAVTVVLLGGLFGAARIAEPTAEARSRLASRFKFTRLEMPAVGNQPLKNVLAVHPSVENISSWISAVGASAAFNDLDADGLPNDLCFIESRTQQVILAPAPGTPNRYPPLTLELPASSFDPSTMSPTGCRLADLNEDSLVDVLVYYFGRTPVVFLQRSDGAPSPRKLSAERFVVQQIGPPGEQWYTTTATLADIDGDGHIDLLFGNYFRDGSGMLDARGSGRVEMQRSMSQAANGGKNRLYLTFGGKSGDSPTVELREAENVLDQQTAHSWTLAVGAADLDGDLLPEIYFANDFGADLLLHNRSTPGQVKLSILTGSRTIMTPKSKVLGNDSFKGMGVDFGDLNGDGRFDMFVSNITSEYALMESHFVWVSSGDPARMREGTAPYKDMSEELGLSRSGWGWETRLADLDNDGVLEAMQATGFVQGSTNRWPELQEFGMGHEELIELPPMWPRIRPDDDVSGHEHNPFYVREAGGRFCDIAAELDMNQPFVTRGIALADVDGDGDQDFAYVNQWMPSYFYRNDSPGSGNFLGLHLLLPLTGADAEAVRARPGHPGPDMNGRQAIFAAASVVLPDGRRLIAEIDHGNGHSGARSPDIHFGLGKVDPGTKLPVELRWRDGTGKVRSSSVHLESGWHTVMLGQKDT